MKRNVSVLLFGAIIAAVMVMGLSGMGIMKSDASTNAISNDKATMLGHATLEVIAPDGHIVAYRQTDNVIVNRGDDCASKALFGSTGGNCAVVTGSGTFKNIAIGTASTHTSGDRTVNALDSELTTGFSVPASGDRVVTSPTITQVGGGTGSVTQLLATFTVSGSQNIAEAGLFDTTGTSAGNMLARQTFTTVQLLSSDSIVVTWNITVN